MVLRRFYGNFAENGIHSGQDAKTRTTLGGNNQIGERYWSLVANAIVLVVRHGGARAIRKAKARFPRSTGKSGQI